MVAVDVGLHLSKSCLLHHVFQRWIDPYSIQSSLRLPPCQPADHSVVESTPNPPNNGLHDLHIRPINHDRLNYCQVNMARGLDICTLPDQHPIQPLLLLPCSLKIVDHRCQIFIRIQENSPKILEVDDWGEENPIGCDNKSL